MRSPLNARSFGGYLLLQRCVIDDEGYFHIYRKRRRHIAALVVRSGITTQRVIAKLPERVAVMLDLPGPQREVRVAPAGRILADPEFCGRDGRAANRFAIAGHYNERRCLRLPLKYVPASVSRSGDDEIWLQTGHMISASRLGNYVRTGKLMRAR